MAAVGQSALAAGAPSRIVCPTRRPADHRHPRRRLAAQPMALYEPFHQQPFASQHDQRRVLNERVAAASQEERQRLLQQLVEAQHALRLLQHTRRQQEAQRQQASWRHAAEQRAARCQAGFGAGLPSTAGGGSSAASGVPSGGPACAGPSGWQPPTASAQRPQQQDPRPQQQQQQQQQQPRHQYQRSHHRHYDRPIDLDDCWGRGAASGGVPGAGGSSTGTHSSASTGSPPSCSTGSSGSGARSSGPRQGRRTSYFSAEGRRSTGSGINNGSERAWWRGFAHDAAAGGFHFHPGGGQREAWAQQAAPHGTDSAGTLEAQVRGQLQQVLSQSGGDLLCFVAALGIRFEAGPDRRAAMRNARTAALLRLHPDHLMREGERQREFGAQATQLVNQLWRAASDR